MIKNKNLFILFLLNLCAIKCSAVISKLNVFQNNQFVEVELPSPYYEKEDGDDLFFLHQNSYVVFDAEMYRNRVIVTGPLQPCIAVALTNDKKLLLFHVSPYNSLPNMKKIILDTFDGDDKNNIYAGIYGLNSEQAWQQAVHGQFYWLKGILNYTTTNVAIKESQPNHTAPNYISQSHSDFIKAIEITIQQSTINHSHIKVYTWNLADNPILEHTPYSHSQHNIAIRMNKLLTDEQEKEINIFSISLMEKNFFNMDNQFVNLEGEPSFSGNYKHIKNLEKMLIDKIVINRYMVNGFYYAFRNVTKSYLNANNCNFEVADIRINTLDFIHQKESGSIF